MNNLIEAVIRECQNPCCKFRFPDTENLNSSGNCLLCGFKTVISETIDLTEDHREDEKSKSTIEIIAILDNLRSVYNAGAIFRTAHGYGIRNIYPCGITPTPIHRKFHKTSLGAEEYVNWEKSLNCVDRCISLKDLGYQLMAIESTVESISLMKIKNDNLDNKRIAIIVGNEIVGIDPKVVSLCDLVVSIPISGENKSFNVTTAFGIAIFHITSLISI